MKVIGIVGWKNSGKTRLVTSLIRYFINKKLNVATIKHAHHNFEIDKKGTDSYLHRKAGAHEVIISSSKRYAKIEEINGEEMSLKNLVKRINNADIIIVEGFKKENHKKIEVIRSINNKEPLYKSLKNIIAIVSNKKINTKIPTFNDKSIHKIADFILNQEL